MVAPYKWAFARELNIRPWEVGLLAVHEVDEAIALIDQINANRARGGD